MEVVNPRAALLSNYEVLTLLRELESDHLARTKAAHRIKKEEEATQTVVGASAPIMEIGENLRTLEVEAIKYLSESYLQTSSQTEEGITRLTGNLGQYELTKAEKLQVVNLLPTLPVELYVIVEELEDRFGQNMDEILSHIKSAFSIPPSGSSVPLVIDERSEHLTSVVAEENQDNEWDAFYDDVNVAGDDEFVDDGAGVGVDGDLEMDEE